MLFEADGHAIQNQKTARFGLAWLSLFLFSDTHYNASLIGVGGAQGDLFNPSVTYHHSLHLRCLNRLSLETGTIAGYGHIKFGRRFKSISCLQSGIFSL